ncbi:bifunctional enoyl-CoA hydratase/phosphate acetyltransferase [Peptostreptococcus porci]|uniref:Bifunctional enoyl-CoA hydratase/phosphate acetyltransferase n=2 Tax=Peptostreptococcus porci TaxID=2652282 RepID=A0A6N7X2W5_9FIRM|nr:bifunctional enoyl-CoA hydratase/phosphate acetyltransferase [Peptostreptococcus porci]MDD7183598.1 bifunctional enoyl-CoA hydratase/phosphate acetyltransferase [Peptostreptococcus porci]MDY4128897.1 bifunctional enoyl-CoA hydratase/phosphate acetyltransferase [Peptostreptococcus porci]MDY4561958.1 bifunctional enoyl-CoA hydratase/phosphate acetyltransferase [Peptostreptococcus porci]MDY5436402.1 bifunctional enoyl-CoA hydratase/phosphate acetyltransferase [Peptostreptococcus porci]MDY54805
MINQDYFVNLAKEKSGGEIQTVAVAAPYDEATLEALRNAVDLGFVKVQLVGEEKVILDAAKNANLNISDMEIVDAQDLADSAQKAVDQVRLGKASLIMKGLIDTSLILKAVVKKENELRTGKTLSYVGILFNEDKDKYFLTSDGAMLIAPDLEQKKGIIENAVEVAHALGNEEPKVAMICAKEKYYEKMPATVDATELQKMNQNGEIKGCIVSGPLQMDNAVDAHAVEVKGIDDPVAGKADILIVPAIEAGNVLLKTAKYLGGWTFGGVVVGAKVPIVVCSRSDGESAKLVSIAVACMMAAKNKK